MTIEVDDLSFLCRSNPSSYLVMISTDSDPLVMSSKYQAVRAYLESALLSKQFRSTCTKNMFGLEIPEKNSWAVSSSINKIPSVSDGAGSDCMEISRIEPSFKEYLTQGFMLLMISQYLLCDETLGMIMERIRLFMVSDLATEIWSKENRNVAKPLLIDTIIIPPLQP